MTHILKSFLNDVRSQVDEYLNTLLPPAEVEPTRLHRAMRYSVFAGGKRLRPALVLASTHLHHGDRTLAMPAACAMEMIHTYSLIHDDLPAMDDDDLRRGKPSCHRAFDEATAILAGDALLTHAFWVLSSRPTEGLSPETRIEVIRVMADAAGTVGMIGGQMADLESEGKKSDLPTVERIHLQKTAALITASLLIGAFIAGTDEREHGVMRELGQRLGLLFQITDDILDCVGDPELIGKSVGKDAVQEKATYPAVAGLDASRIAAEQLAEEARELIRPHGDRGTIFIELTEFLLRRTH